MSVTLHLQYTLLSLHAMLKNSMDGTFFITQFQTFENKEENIKPTCNKVGVVNLCVLKSVNWL